MYTIGHSNHAIEHFIELLERFAVDCVCDVRSAPYSRRNPQFNRETLRDSLKQQGIRYVYLGKELGARTEDEACYVNGKVSFERLAATPLFRKGIERVLEGDKTFTIALMCAEKEPLNCHRTILVARHLTSLGVPIEHILESGASERHEATIDRLIDIVGLPREDLFSTYDDIIERAYRIRGGDVAYTDASGTGRE